MRITVDRNQLLKSLGRVHRVVERRNTVPILSNVLIDVDKNGVQLKATDLDLEVTESFVANIKQEGAITVPAHLLYDIVRKLPDGSEIVLSVDMNQASTMSVVSGCANFQLQCLPKVDFPESLPGQFGYRFSLSTSGLKHLLDCTQFAISTEETRYYLNGIYFHVIDDGVLKLRLVATDGHRLAQVDMEAPSGVEGMPGVIVPRKTVGELQKLLSEEVDADVCVELSETKIRFSIGSVVFTSKLIDGTFPEYQRVIPLGNDKKLIVNRQDFSSAVDRVSTISSDRGRAVKLTIEQGQLKLIVHNPDSGSAEDQLAVTYTSDPLEIGFNSRYLLDIAGQLSSDEMVFMLAEAGAPALIRNNGVADALYVLMPIRV
ncbi:DNA polymerase III subunit beta [Bartonella henselae]|uniref:Beta sliding clamp n=1 Tax=Bartonella henselae TaxID=38323 RepID=X5M301_BARHN|nr:DNA polymerase III subunit beta [Bartonella henselae]MDM9996449.1 DNA polymerase III subunit beta [Bartonella henselae]OLL47599.1 DNA polymerase III subunit beta [Bartonella henselae]OLL50161.1 DNA polymerase III subunit beta [Bartonella henselae]OLL50632.1 DNA polymerase III subunit beta [Bartonella henselae]OLL56381.1 DNA polymerase III subunit beta [Bartonella henselae]